MLTWFRRELRTYRDGARILASREFWRYFRWYGLAEDGGFIRALDTGAARLSEITGKPYERRFPPSQ